MNSGGAGGRAVAAAGTSPGPGLGIKVASGPGGRRLEWGHARALSSRAVAAVSRFPSRGSMDLRLSLEAFHEAF